MSGFTFGGTPAPATAAAPTPAAAAAPTGGFSFGGAPAAAAPAFGAPATAPPATSLTAPAAAPALPTTIAPLATPTALTSATTAAANTQNLLQIPDFGDVFRYLHVSAKVQSLLAQSKRTVPGSGGVLSAQAQLAGQELIHLLQQSPPQPTAAAGTNPGSPQPNAPFGSSLSKPAVIQWVQPNAAVRQQLEQPNITVFFTGIKKDAPLNQGRKKAVLQLSTELRISELHAIALLKSYDTDPTLQRMATTQLNDQLRLALHQVSKPNSVLQGPRSLYFLERGQLLQSLLLLVQSRLEGSDFVIQATDQLLQNNLLPNLVALIKQYSQHIAQLQQQVTEHSKKQRRQHQLQFQGSGQVQGQPNMPGASFGNGTQNSNAGGGFFGQPSGAFSNQSGTSANANAAGVVAASKPPFALAHLIFCQQQRQLAVDALFYLAYHTQLQVDEVVMLLDLVKELSDSLVQLDPTVNVPNPYQEQLNPAQAAPAGWGAMTTPPPKEKEELGWQSELISLIADTGHTKLLTCVAPLIMACVAAMDSRQVLFDRNIHGPNKFGMGNALLPPGIDPNAASGQLAQLHSKLVGNACDQWRRKDVWGILSASYGLLLRSAPALLASPRHASLGVASGPLDLRSASRECLESPTILKAFTFCRLTLIPALQRLPMTSLDQSLCDTSEFTLSVLSETIAHYLNILISAGQLPQSRTEWEQERNTELKISRQERDKERKFLAWSGATVNPNDEPHIPDSVDLMERPDCMDDLIALASTLCFIGPNFAYTFWSKEGPNHDLVSSPALEALERQQHFDSSLSSSYVTFLAGLSLAETGADAVHALLSRPPATSEDSSGAHSYPTWTSILETIRWYAQQLSPYNFENVSAATKFTSANRSTAGSSKPDTAYYYNAQPNGSFQSGSSMTSRGGPDSSTSASTSPSKPKELGKKNLEILASHLVLLMNVAERSPAARCHILNLKLPVITNGRVTGGDECLLVLFLLAIAPLDPIMRGAAMTATAKLLDMDGADATQKGYIQQMAMNGWELLENSQILPISMLGQYPELMAPTATNNQMARATISFPPSSIALSAGGSKSSTLPPDQNYGIVYELEHIESRLGFYPSTEGFLQLVTSLISAGGCPMNLGHEWRLRTGCTPYIEFVVDFLLPKTQINVRHSTTPLPFRLESDRSRLITVALRLAEAALAQYTVPTKLSKSSESNLESAQTILGAKGLSNDLLSAQREQSHSDEVEYEKDFRNISINRQSGDGVNDPADRRTAAYGSPAKDVAGALPDLPRTKTGAFAILSDILSTSRGNIFQAILATLVENGGVADIASHGDVTDTAALVYSLFGETPPSMRSAKAGLSSSPTKRGLQSLLKPMVLAVSTCCVIEPSTFPNGTYWREKCIIQALRLLCAAVVREASFYESVLASRELLKIVPSLRFSRHRGASNIVVKDVQLSRLSELILTMAGSERLRTVLAGLIGYTATTQQHDEAMASLAVGVFHYLYKSGPAHVTVGALCGRTVQGQHALAQSVAKRILVSSKRLESKTDGETVGLLLSLILEDARSKVAFQEDGLAQCLLGLPSSSAKGNWTPATGHVADDCFDAVISLVRRRDFVESTESASIATMIFELFHRLMDHNQGTQTAPQRVAMYAAERLRHEGLFRENLLQFLDPIAPGSPSYLALLTDTNNSAKTDDVVHSIAWFLKSAASEIRLLSGGFDSSATMDPSSISAASFAPKPSQCFELFDILFNPGKALVQMAMDSVALDRAHIDPTLRVPPADVLAKCTVPLQGSSDVTSGYEVVSIDKLKQIVRDPTNRRSMEEWTEEWNRSVQWHCSSWHLVNAFHCLIGSSIVAARRLSESMILTGQDSTILDIGGYSNILATILKRLNNESSPYRHKGMDASLFPPSTLQLSSTVLLLTDRITSNEANSSDPAWESILLALSGMLMSTIEASWMGEEQRKLERTAVLAGALTKVIRSLVRSGSDLSGSVEEVIPIGQTLVQMASLDVKKVPATPLLARAALMSVLDALSEADGSTRDTCVVHKLLGNSMRAILQLLPQFDESVCHLLEKVALRQFGSKILLQSGVFDALLAASHKYHAEEREVTQSLREQHATFQADSLGAPPFLFGHFKLLVAMLSSGDEEIAERALQVYASYEPLLRRLCLQFPQNTAVIRLFVEGLLQAAAIMRPIGSTKGKAAGSASYAFDKHLVGGALMSNVVMILVEELTKNPWPPHLLTSSSMNFQNNSDVDSNSNNKSFAASVVPLPAESKTTWWDRVDTALKLASSNDSNINNASNGMPNSTAMGTTFAVPSDIMVSPQERWPQAKFDQAIAAIEILRLVLSLLKRTRNYDTIGFTTLCQGLCKCAEVARNAQRRSAELDGSHATTFTSQDDADLRRAEFEYMKTLGTSFARCTQEYLILALLRLRTARGNPNSGESLSSFDDFRHKLGSTLDASRIERDGIGCLGMLHDSADEVTFSMTIVKEIRNELR